MHCGHGYKVHTVHMQNEKFLWRGGREQLKAQCINSLYYSDPKITKSKQFVGSREKHKTKYFSSFVVSLLSFTTSCRKKISDLSPLTFVINYFFLTFILFACPLLWLSHFFFISHQIQEIIEMIPF